MEMIIVIIGLMLFGLLGGMLTDSIANRLISGQEPNGHKIVKEGR